MKCYIILLTFFFASKLFPPTDLLKVEFLMLAVILLIGLAYQLLGKAVSDDRLILRILHC